MIITSLVGTSQTNLSLLAANLGGASAAFSAISATVTKPTSGIILDTLPSFPSLVKVIPIQASSTKLTGVGMRVVGWNSYNGTLWIPTILGEFTLGYTSATLTAVASNYYLSSIAQLAGTSSANLYSPATQDPTSISPCSALIDMIGAQLVQVQFKDSTNAATFGAYWCAI